MQRLPQRVVHSWLKEKEREVLGTMVAQTSWVQSGELLPDLLLSS